MKYLKKYKLFESEINDDIKVCRDLLLELEDDGYEIEVNRLSNKKIILIICKRTTLRKGREHTPHHLVSYMDLKINFSWRDIEYYVKPVIEFLVDSGYRPYTCPVRTPIYIDDIKHLHTQKHTGMITTAVNGPQEYYTKCVIYFEK